MLTSEGLVKHVKMANKEKWGYVWGTFGLLLTLNIFQEKLAQYPDGVGKYEDFIKKNWMNKRTVDCIGLIKSYIWWEGTNPKYDPCLDITANEMFKVAADKGPMSTFPDSLYPKDNGIPGLCVWKDGHIGVYIGGGLVIEARGTMYGVVLTPLRGNLATEWTHWLKCPFVEYGDVIRKGSTNLTVVKWLQSNLNKLGYSLTVDGSFGSKTEDAITNFQSNNNIIPDGVAYFQTQREIEKMVRKLETNGKKTYVQIIQENSNNNAAEWVRAIDTVVDIAKDNGGLNFLKILTFLPALIEKIGNKTKQ